MSCGDPSARIDLRRRDEAPVREGRRRCRCRCRLGVYYDPLPCPERTHPLRWPGSRARCNDHRRPYGCPCLTSGCRVWPGRVRRADAPSVGNACRIGGCTQRRESRRDSYFHGSAGRTGDLRRESAQANRCRMTEAIRPTRYERLEAEDDSGKSPPRPRGRWIQSEYAPSSPKRGGQGPYKAAGARPSGRLLLGSRATERQTGVLEGAPVEERRRLSSTRWACCCLIEAKREKAARVSVHMVSAGSRADAELAERGRQGCKGSGSAAPSPTVEASVRKEPRRGRKGDTSEKGENL